MNLECTLQKESAKKLQSAINGEVWSRMVPRSAVGLLSLRLCSCGRAARTARGWFETAPVSHCYLSLLFWTSARLSGFCPLCVCAWTCGCVTDTPQYVRSAPRSQISEDHSDWHANETKSGSVLHIYWFQNLSNVTNNFVHLGDTLPPRD